jgi:hypothetical protein
MKQIWTGIMLCLVDRVETLSSADLPRIPKDWGKKN